MRISFPLHIFHHLRDIGLGVGFFFPQIERYIQLFIVFLQVVHRHRHNMIPQSAVSPVSLLQLMSCRHGFFFIGFVFLGTGAGRRIDLLQFTDGKGRFLGIFSLIIFLKINQIRLSFLQFCNNQPHLQSPVSQMHIADHLMSQETSHPFYTFTNDGGAQMPHVERLGHIRAAVIDDHRFGILRLIHGKLRILSHLFQVGGQKFPFHIEIDKTGFHHFHFGKHGTLAQIRHNILSDHERGFFICFRSRHGPVALKLAEVRTV